MRRHLITEGGEPRSEIVIDRGLAGVASIVLPQRADRRSIAVFCQPPTHALARRLTLSAGETGVAAQVIELPDGEEGKTIEVVESAYRRLNDLALTRSDTVVGVGGGALTDVAGFIAATYLRGVEAVYVPTTLLGAVDAAIGGKTAVNVDGKNLAGAFAHPTRVAIDLDVLEELPPELIRQGSAEAFKAGMVGDPDLVALYAEHGNEAPLREVVDRAVAVKTAVVGEDFLERGTRAFLNYGHTIGHAVEVESGISHGEAVAVGMVAAAALSEREVGFTGAARQRDLIERLGLPTSSPSVDAARVRALIDLDKKRDRTGTRMVLLEEVAHPVIINVDDAAVRSALEAVGIS
jgi:3-dehydroquinate synthase